MNNPWKVHLTRAVLGCGIAALSACHAAPVPAISQSDALPASRTVPASGTDTIACVTGTLSSGYPYSCQNSGLNSPDDVAVDAHGNVYIADTGNSAIKMVSPQGTVKCITGTLNSDGSCGSTAFNTPSGVAVDSKGNVYVADSGSDAIREVLKPLHAPWRVKQLAAGFSFDVPETLVVDAKGTVFVADADSSAVYRITGGTVACVGRGKPPSCSGSGFNHPYGVALDGAGNLYVGDTGNNVVKRVKPNGKIAVLGSGFLAPSGVAVDPACRLRCYVYVADTNHNQVKQIAPSGATSVIGSSQYCGSGTCLFQNPLGVAAQVGCNGTACTIYVDDTGNYSVKEVRR